MTNDYLETTHEMSESIDCVVNEGQQNYGLHREHESHAWCVGLSEGNVAGESTGTEG